MTPQCLLLYREMHAREIKQTQLTEVARYCHGVSYTLTDQIPSIPHIYPYLHVVRVFSASYLLYYRCSTTLPTPSLSHPKHQLGGGIIAIMSTRSRSRSTLRQRSMERGNRLTKSMSAAASRNTSPSPSPGTANRRVAKLNLYLSRSARASSEQLHRGADASLAIPKSTCIRRWDGNGRMTVKWDSLRRASRRAIIFNESIY